MHTRIRILLLLFCTTPIYAQPASAPATDAPYVRAIGIVRGLQKGPDANLIDREAPLDDRTKAFLERNQEVFTLLRAGAQLESAEFGEKPGDVQSIIDQLSGVRPMAVLGVLRARMLFDEKKLDAALDQLADVIALSRHLPRAGPVLITQMVAVGVDEMAMKELALHVPELSAEQASRYIERSKSFAPRTSMAELLRGERLLGAKLLTDQIGATAAPTAEALGPFYEALAKACEVDPPLSSEAFGQKAGAAVGAINDKNAPAAKVLAQTLLSSFQTFYRTYWTNHLHGQMLNAALQSRITGEAALADAKDPFGDGPFECIKHPQGFELRSKFPERKGTPVQMKFGK